MDEYAIRVEHLGKRFRIGEWQTGVGQYKTLRDAISWRAARLRTWVMSRSSRRHAAPPASETSQRPLIQDFWALKDISFDVRPGEVLGIIGPNGSGKSTLLKILSRITEPTEGRAELRGRVRSLLEVGTGFHQELTGRENIYMNGAILGMRKSEIDRKFDEIVAFSEIEQFIDTPVKRYSSGMYVRLAFAVAAHLEPDILLVDEVLAVGDAGFQKKCIGKMSDVAKGGRTVLFVSHDMNAVARLCSTGIYLQRGKVIDTGAIHALISRYNAVTAGTASRIVDIPRYGLRITDVSLTAETGRILPNKSLTITIVVEAEYAVQGLALDLTICTESYPYYLVSTSTKPHHDLPLHFAPGKNIVQCRIGALRLCSDTYSLGLGIGIPQIETLFFERDYMRFDVEESIHADSALATVPGNGRVYLDEVWEQLPAADHADVEG